MLERDNKLSSDIVGRLSVDNETKGLIRSVLNEGSFKAEHVFTTGHSGCVVLKVKDEEQEDLVLKISTDKRSQDEVVTNLKGYHALEQAGLSELIPDYLMVGKKGDTIYLLTSFLGDDFESLSRKIDNPEILYEDLITRMDRIYTKSTKRDNESNKSIERATNLLRSNFRNHILPSGLIEEEQANAIFRFEQSLLYSDISSFGVFDFTPEDIYLWGDTIKYPDPKENVRGNPLIDLACFAGVSRDVYQMPGSERGYELIHSYAVETLSQLVEVDGKTAEQTFNLGRSLQYSLSSRFRVGSDPQRAREYAQLSIDYIKREIID